MKIFTHVHVYGIQINIILKSNKLRLHD